ncbi:MAG TPA: hypothetical protein VMH49_04060 [Thermoplasmata archaeon]|nr:hypothetical protein [Thermoplasmata archaeon]
MLRGLRSAGVLGPLPSTFFTVLGGAVWAAGALFALSALAWPGYLSLSVPEAIVCAAAGLALVLVGRGRRSKERRGSSGPRR